MSDITIPVTSARREFARMLQRLQHAAPGAVLLWQGLRRFGAHGEGMTWLLGFAEIAASVLVIVSFARSLRASRSTHGPGPHAGGGGWFDIFLAGMLAVEATAHWHDTGHLPRPTVLLAVVVLGLGLFHGRLAASRERRDVFQLTSDGITVQNGLFGGLTATWGEIAYLELDAAHARIVTRDGRIRRVGFRHRLSNDDAVRALGLAQSRIDETRARSV